MSETQDEHRDPVESTWGGITKWDCPFCARDSLDRADLQAHIDFAHPAPSLSIAEAIALENSSPSAPIAPIPEEASAPPIPVEAPGEETPAPEGVPPESEAMAPAGEPLPAPSEPTA